MLQLPYQTSLRTKKDISDSRRERKNALLAASGPKSPCFVTMLLKEYQIHFPDSLTAPNFSSKLVFGQVVLTELEVEEELI